MNICLIAPVPPPYGGIANWTVLMDEYVKTVDDVQLLHINIASKKRVMDGRTLWDRVVVQGFEMFEHNKSLKKMIRSEKIDVIHMTTSGSLATFRDILLLKTAKKLGVPTVYHIRIGRVPEISQNNTSEWKLLRKAMGIANCVMVIDTTTYNAVKKYAPEVNVCYVPNPFDPKKLDGIDVSEDVKKEVVFVGWVIKTKGVEELLEAWQNVHESFPEWNLRIVGPYDEQYLNGLKSRFSMENVVFDGEKPNAEAIKTVSQASVFTLPSYTEGFPNAVLEAMALGKPIVATSVGAIPDMLEGCGIVVEPKNAKMLSIALTELMRDEQLRTKLSENAKKRLENEYTIDLVFDSYRKSWNDIISERN